MTTTKERAGETDGRLFMAGPGDVVPGTVLRMVSPSDGSAAPFSDHTILDVKVAGADSPVGQHLGYAEVTLARPYLYASAGGSALTGVETMKVDARSITRPDSLFRVVVTSRGEAHSFRT